MRLCIYEDSRVLFLEPATLTRPAFDLRCGAQTLLERLRRVLQPSEVGAWVRPRLAELTRFDHPELRVNEDAWLGESRVVFVNARWLPEEGTHIDAREAHVGWCGEQVAYFVLPEPADLPDPEQFDNWLPSWTDRLPRREAGGVLLDYLWEAIEQNAALLERDWNWFRAAGERSASVTVQGPPERLVLAHGSVVEPFVLFDARSGPILVDEGATIHSFSRIEGPCYIGKGSTILGAKLRGANAIGPVCRFGGEVEASIVQGYSNKYHEGFLGHSYVGSWVNLAAGTHTSDLRNDYGEVKISVAGLRFTTGLNKLGALVGDFTKTALGVLLNTGSTLGAFAHVLPSGSLQPTEVPSFCSVKGGQLQELWDLRKLFHTADVMMARRGQQFTDMHRDVYDALYEATSETRRHAVAESETRRLSRSV